MALFRTHGVPMALATNCNPSSSPTTMPTMIMNLACTLFRLTPEEAVSGFTRAGARALRVEADYGTLELGKAADLAVWDVHTMAELPYMIAHNPCIMTVKAGRIIYQAPPAFDLRHPGVYCIRRLLTMSTPPHEQLRSWLDANGARASRSAGFTRLDTSNPPGDTRLARPFSAAPWKRQAQVKTVAPQADKPNLVTTIEGIGPGAHLVLNGHIDVFPAGDRARWQRDPSRVTWSTARSMAAARSI